MHCTAECFLQSHSICSKNGCRKDPEVQYLPCYCTSKMPLSSTATAWIICEDFSCSDCRTSELKSKAAAPTSGSHVVLTQHGCWIERRFKIYWQYLDHNLYLWPVEENISPAAKDCFSVCVHVWLLRSMWVGSITGLCSQAATRCLS